jgi:hypothetical protein
MPSHALSNLPVGSLMGLEVRLAYLAWNREFHERHPTCIQKKERKIFGSYS